MKVVQVYGMTLYHEIDEINNKAKRVSSTYNMLSTVPVIYVEDMKMFKFVLPIVYKGTREESDKITGMPLIKMKNVKELCESYGVDYYTAKSTDTISTTLKDYVDENGKSVELWKGLDYIDTTLSVEDCWYLYPNEDNECYVTVSPMKVLTTVDHPVICPDAPDSFVRMNHVDHHEVKINISYKNPRYHISHKKVLHKNDEFSCNGTLRISKDRSDVIVNENIPFCAYGIVEITLESEYLLDRPYSKIDLSNNIKRLLDLGITRVSPLITYDINKITIRCTLEMTPDWNLTKTERTLVSKDHKILLNVGSLLLTLVE